MAKKKEPEKQGNEELFLALNLLEKEKGIPVEFMLDKIKKAISTACKNNYGNEDVDIDVDREKGVFNVYLRKEIVEELWRVYCCCNRQSIGRNIRISVLLIKYAPGPYRLIHAIYDKVRKPNWEV